MKRIVTADWHLQEGAEYRFDFVEHELLHLLDKHKPFELLILGDLTEAKDHHSASLVNRIVSLFKCLSDRTHVIFLCGNHDYLHVDHPYFNFLMHLRGVRFINKATVVNNCLFLPHTRDYQRDWIGVDLEGHDYIFTHNTFAGARNNGQKLAGIPTRIFPVDACVISGDIHAPQTFDVVTYVGAPVLVDFGDQYDPRVLLLDGDAIRSIKVRGPQRRVIEVRWDDKDPNFSYPGFRFGLNAGDIIKFKVHLERKHVAEWDAIRKLVQVWGMERNLIVHAIVPIVTYDTKRGDGLGESIQSKRRSDANYFDDYVGRLGIDERTANVGKDLMKE